jgi:hypothetical protein
MLCFMKKLKSLFTIPMNNNLLLIFQVGRCIIAGKLGELNVNMYFKWLHT